MLAILYENPLSLVNISEVMANAQKLKESCGEFVTFGSEQFSSEEQAAVQKALQQRLGPNFIRFVV